MYGQVFRTAEVKRELSLKTVALLIVHRDVLSVTGCADIPLRGIVGGKVGRVGRIEYPLPVEPAVVIVIPAGKDKLHELSCPRHGTAQQAFIVLKIGRGDMIDVLKKAVRVVR